jgi:hypothetical protein
MAISTLDRAGQMDREKCGQRRPSIQTLKVGSNSGSACHVTLSTADLEAVPPYRVMTQALHIHLLCYSNVPIAVLHRHRLWG